MQDSGNNIKSNHQYLSFLIDCLNNNQTIDILPAFNKVSVIDNQEESLSLYDEPKKALCILEDTEFSTKVFCKDYSSKPVFEVKSNKWDWIVSPLKNANEIPARFHDRLKAVLSNSEIKKIAIAKPKPREAVDEVITQEIADEARTVFRFLTIMMLLAVKCLGWEFMPKEKESKRVNTSKVELPDPVLLVLVSGVWVEIARWE